jgi:hypothetical protein
MRRQRTINRRRLLVALVIALLTVGVISYLAASASAARPTQHTAEVRSNWAIDQLCGGGTTVCVRRYPAVVFYGCGRNAKCWNVCYTHVERSFFSWRKHYRCSTGQIKYSIGFLTYYYEY